MAAVRLGGAGDDSAFLRGGRGLKPQQNGVRHIPGDSAFLRGGRGLKHDAGGGVAWDDLDSAFLRGGRGLKQQIETVREALKQDSAFLRGGRGLKCVRAGGKGNYFNDGGVVMVLAVLWAPVKYLIIFA